MPRNSPTQNWLTLPVDSCFPSQNQSRSSCQSILGTTLQGAHQGRCFHLLLGIRPGDPILSSPRVPASIAHLHPQSLSHTRAMLVLKTKKPINKSHGIGILKNRLEMHQEVSPSDGFY